MLSPPAQIPARVQAVVPRKSWIGSPGRLLERYAKEEESMELTTAEIGREITKISLSGRLDIDGALKIDGPFMDIVKEKKLVAADLSDVAFLASLGMRRLVSGAKASWEHGGRMVLLKPQENVEKF